MSNNTLIGDFRDIYEARNILRSLVAKHLYGKYRNSVLGFAWNFITPLILLLMYYLIFTEIRGDSNIENKWVFITSAIFMFNFLIQCITGGTTAFTGNANMIKKMYFPKEILVLSHAISSMIVCIIGHIIVLITLAITSYPIDFYCILLLLPLLILAFIFGLGTIFFLSTLTVYVRDIQYALGSIGIALFILTPMRYMASSATGLLETILWLNPLTYYIEYVHSILYWSVFPEIGIIAMCVVLSFGALSLGYLTFRKLKRGFVKRL